MLTEQIKKFSSVSIVGMAKNTGKTTCLNYVLSKLKDENYNVAVTSIGVDGEEKDVLYDTLKPRITLHSGNIFITSEKHFDEKRIDARIISVSKSQTALGRLVTAEALSTGQVILSGPSEAELLSDYIDKLKEVIPLVLVDGALNRMSLASPSVTDALVLCTGAACSIRLEQLIKKVKYQCELININKIGTKLENKIRDIDSGVWAINEDEIIRISDSLFTSNIDINMILETSNNIYVAGALTDNFMHSIIQNKKIENLTIILRDFSRIFASPKYYYKFVRKGGKFKVKQCANLIAVCSNPTSPEGYNYNANELRSALAEEVNVPVYDILQTD